MPPIRRQFQIHIDRPPETVFAFVTDLANHPRTSPPEQNEQVLQGWGAPLGRGTRIVFRARHGLIYHTLEAEIAEFDPPALLVDRQIKGPFAAWTHRHRFAPFQQGTLMTDQIEYVPPYGPLGLLVDRLWLGRHLDRFFQYRQQATKRYLEQGPKRLFTASGGRR